MAGWETVDESPKPKASGWETVEEGPKPSDFQPTQYGFKVRQGEAPTGGPATIREDNAINFPGQSNWHFWDPQTQQYTPAPSEPWANKGFLSRNLGADTLAENARNFGIGTERAVNAGLAAAQGVFNRFGATRQTPEQVQSDLTAAQRVSQIVQAMKATGKPSAEKYQTAGEMAPAMVASTLAPTAGPTFLARALPGALTFGTATGLTTEGDLGERSKAAALATGGALAGQGIMEKGVIPLAGKALGGASKLVSRLKAPMNPEAQAIQDLGDKFGVRTLAPDLVPPGQMAKLGVLAESVPGSGMVGQRVAQQAEAQAAAQKLLEQHGISGDAASQIQQGLKNQLATGKANASSAYDLVGKLAEGKGEVPLTETLDAIKKFKAQEASAAIPDQGLVGLLDKMESRLTGKTPTPGLSQSGVDTYGTPILKAQTTTSGPTVDKTFEGVRGLRSDLGSMISDYYKGTNAATGSKGVQVLQGIKGALENDLGNFTSKNGPELAQAAKKADSIYKSQVVPFKDRALAAAVKSSEPDQIYKTFIQVGKGDRAQKFYNALDADGQAAVRSQMVQNAMDAATSGAQPFSPAKFAQSLEKIKDSTGVFFKGQDKFELDGFTNLMRHIQRAGQVGENPSNGQRLVQILIAGEGGGAVLGAMAGHPAALIPAGASAASANALTRIFASPLGKRLLLNASSIKAGSPAMEKLIETDLPKILGASIGSQAASNVSPLRPQLPVAASTGNPDQIAENK